jgi:hypothetical protein
MVREFGQRILVFGCVTPVRYAAAALKHAPARIGEID